MSNLLIDDIVQVNVSVSKTSTVLPSFSLGLIVGQSDVITATQRVKIYANLSSILADGFTETSAEYLAAKLYFSQSQKPDNVAIGRWNYPTETALQAVTACRTANNAWYGCYVCNASKAEIIAIAGYIETVKPASVLFFDTHDTEILSGTAGNVFDSLKTANRKKTFGIYSTSNTQTAGYETSGAGASTNISSGSATTFKIAVDGDSTPKTVTLTVAGLNTGNLIASAIQSGIQALSGVYAGVTVAFVNNRYVITSGTTGTTSSVVVTKGTTNDVAATLKLGTANGAIDTTGTITYKATGAAVLGYAMGANTTVTNSAYTLMFKSLIGIDMEDLASELSYIESVNGNAYINRGSTYNVLEKGVMADGTYFDEVLGLDMLTNNIQVSVMDALQSNPKIPYTDSGVNILVNAITRPCDEARRIGFITQGIWKAEQFQTIKIGDTLPMGYKIIAESVASQTAENIANRISPPIYVAIILAGAVQSVVINVNVS